jgi:hypothetical protein
LAAPAEAETVAEIARFGVKKLYPPRRSRSFVAGGPAHDQLDDIRVAWVAARTGVWPSTAKLLATRDAKDAMYTDFSLRCPPAFGAGSGERGWQGRRDRGHPPSCWTMPAIEGAVATIDAMAEHRGRQADNPRPDGRSRRAAQADSIRRMRNVATGDDELRFSLVAA